MTKFNIVNSKVEQMNNSGNNYKTSADNYAISSQGDVVQLVGDSSQSYDNSAFWPQLLNKIKSCWKFIVSFYRN